MGQKAASRTSQTIVSETERYVGQPDQALLEPNDGASSIDEGLLETKCTAPSVEITPDFDAIRDWAVKEIKEKEEEFSLADDNKQSIVRTMIARLYLLSMVGLKDAERHNDWVASTNITVRGDTPHHKRTVRAALKESGTKLFKSSEDDYTLQLRAMEHEDVPLSEVAAAAWLSKPLHVKGKKLTGKRKARHILRSCAEYQGEMEDKRAQRALEREEIFTSVYAQKATRPFGTIEVLEYQVVPEGVWLSLNDGEKVLAVLSSDEAEVASLVARFEGRG